MIKTGFLELIELEIQGVTKPKIRNYMQHPDVYKQNVIGNI